jgi:hypothetical protein
LYKQDQLPHQFIRKGDPGHHAGNKRFLNIENRKEKKLKVGSVATRASPLALCFILFGTKLHVTLFAGMLWR